MSASTTPTAKILPIAVAEGASTLVSLGAVLAMGRCESALNPLRDCMARHFIYPAITQKTAPPSITTNDPTFQQACDKASMFIKGGVMVGAGFASHIPIQLMLEGHYDPSTIGHAVMGKSAGVAVALGSIMLLNRTAPQLLPSLQKAICPALAPYLPTRCNHGCAPAEETCQLLMVDVPSAVISGFINYNITRRMMHA